MDAARREIERRLAANPGDGDAWLRLSLDAERAGREGDAASRGLRLDPEHAGLIARVADLAGDGAPWPTPRGGFSNAQRSARCGPAEGVQRWRLELPGTPVGGPIVDADGSVVVATFPSGLVRVSADATHATTFANNWPASVPPVFHEGRVVGFHPGLGGPVTAPREGPVPGGLLRLAAAPTGWAYGWGDDVVAVPPEGELGWIRRLDGLKDLAVSGDGTVAAVQSDGDMVVLAPETGRTTFSLRNVLRVAFAPDGALLVQGGSLACYEPDGTQRWDSGLPSVVGFAADVDAVVASSAVQGVASFDLATGRRRWRRTSLRVGGPPALDARGVAYVLGGGWFEGLGVDGDSLFHLPLRALPDHVALGLDRTAFFTAGRELVAVR